MRLRLPKLTGDEPLPPGGASCTVVSPTRRLCWTLEQQPSLPATLSQTHAPKPPEPKATVFSVMRTCASNVRFKKNEGVLLTECIFTLSYTKFETETRPKQGDALLTEGARISERIWYIARTHDYRFELTIYHAVGLPRDFAWLLALCTYLALPLVKKVTVKARMGH